MDSLRPINNRCLKPLKVERINPLNLDEKEIYNDKPFRINNYRLKR